MRVKRELREREVMFCGKKEIGKSQTKHFTFSKKTEKQLLGEKSQEQEDIARREFDSVAFCSSNQVRVG